MKMSKTQRLTLLLVTLLGLGACKKDNASKVPLSDAALLSQTLNAAAPAFQDFSMDVSKGGSITTVHGTKITFPSNFFLKPDGSLVSGSITLRVKEFQNVSEMILANRPTGTNTGAPLESFGEFFIEARQGNVKLQLAKDSINTVMVKIKKDLATGTKEIQMWDGDTTVDITSSGYDYQNNTASVTETFYSNKGIDWSANGAYSFFNAGDATLNFSLDSLFKWTNCDRLMDQPGAKTTVMAYMGTHFNTATGHNYGGEEPSMLFFKPKGINSVIKFYDVIFSSPSSYQGLHSYQNTMAIGMQGTFLAMSVVDGKFYAELKDVTIADPGSFTYVPVNFTMNEVSAANMISMINSMASK